MDTKSTTWDIGEEILVRKHARRLSGAVVTTARNVVFAALAVAGPQIQSPLIAASTPGIIEVLRVSRKDAPVPAARSNPGDVADTKIGMSTGRLADLFPLAFRPAEEEPDNEPFVLD